jgi:hypothetical protein
LDLDINVTNESVKTLQEIGFYFPSNVNWLKTGGWKKRSNDVIEEDYLDDKSDTRFDSCCWGNAVGRTLYSLFGLTNAVHPVY